MRPVVRGAPTPSVTTLSTERRRTSVSHNYHAVGASLLTRLGEYCSYCEAPLSGNAAIEHIISKSTTPQLETLWENFLLACVNCNSTKGSTKVMSVASLSRYIWACTPQDSVVTIAGQQTAFYSPTSLFDYYHDGTYAQVRVAQGAVDPDANRDADKKARAAATLAMVGLDKPFTATTKASDRRIPNRTDTWAIALRLGEAYSQRIPDTGIWTDAFGPLFEAQLIELAKARGFWSVWMKIFRDRLTTNRPNMTAPALEAVLVRLFCKTFPGTYYTGMANAPAANTTGLPLS